MPQHRKIQTIHAPGPFRVTIQYTCPKSGKSVDVQPNIGLEGDVGCCQQEYCYCGYPEVEASVYPCPECGNRHVFDVKDYVPRTD